MDLEDAKIEMPVIRNKNRTVNDANCIKPGTVGTIKSLRILKTNREEHTIFVLWENVSRYQTFGWWMNHHDIDSLMKVNPEVL